MEKFNFKKIAVASFAIAAASLASMSAHSDEHAKKGAKADSFKCEGSTSCAGKGACKTVGSNECAGKNGCAGKGFTMTKDTKACDAMKKSHETKKGA